MNTLVPASLSVLITSLLCLIAAHKHSRNNQSIAMACGRLAIGDFVLFMIIFARGINLLRSDQTVQMLRVFALVAVVVIIATLRKIWQRST